MSDIQNRFIRVLASGILGWLLTLLAFVLTTIGIDPASESGQAVIAWMRASEPILVIILSATANALIAKLSDKFPNLHWMERLLNPFNGRIPTYIPNDKV